MANDPPPNSKDWLTPRDYADRSSTWRRRSRREHERERAMSDWYGETAWAEIEAHQQPAEQLGNVLDEVFHKLKMDDKVLLRRIMEQWPQIVGAEVAMHTAPEVIQRDTLLVTVSDPTWRFRLQGQLRYLGEKLQEFTNNEVKRVKLVAGGRTAAGRT